MVAEKLQRTKREFWINPAEAILGISLLLAIIGLVNVFSASFVLAWQLFQDSYYFIKRQTAAFVIGIACMGAMAWMPYQRLEKYAKNFAYLVIGLLIAVYFGGVDANGAKRWLTIGVKFQPSELAKVAAVLLTAAYLGRRMQWGRKITLQAFPAVLLLIMFALVMKQPDMGTALVIIAPCLLLYLLAGIPLKEKLILMVVGGAGVVGLIYVAAYRFDRVAAWLDPWSYRQGIGYQVVQSFLAIGSGGATGTGLGMGASKFHYLPEAHTDFAFALFCQEHGFVGAVAVLLLFGLFGWYGIKIAVRASDGFGTMLAGGLTILIVGQALANIAMVSGVIPVTGVPLPFISYGGTSLVVNMVAVGIIIGVGRQASAKDQAVKPEEETESSLEKRRRLRLVPPPRKER